MQYFVLRENSNAGEEDSHSLYFELKYNWTGLLVEPVPNRLEWKGRRATVSRACLATQTSPHIAPFAQVNWPN